MEHKCKSMLTGVTVSLGKYKIWFWTDSFAYAKYQIKFCPYCGIKLATELRREKKEKPTRSVRCGVTPVGSP